MWSAFAIVLALADGLSLVSPPAQLRNRYFAIRHGQSTANVANIISSDPYVGSTMHELTELGKEQATDAGAALWREIGHDSCTIYSSNFTRARETKDVAAFELLRLRQSDSGIFDQPPIRVGLLEALRERDFGELDGLNTGAYDVVWPRDCEDPSGTHGDGVESVFSVCERLSEMITLLEERHDNEAIGLCSHADVLQIFQCWMAGVEIGTFSSYRIKNGEVRLCDKQGSSLPDPVPMASQASVAA